MSVFQLPAELIFPPVHLADKSGLLAIGGDLSVDRLILAYQNGIFPWYGEEDPICWWSPHPRFVLFPNDLYISDRFARFCRKSRWTVTVDHSFNQVVQKCASVLRKEEGTWLLSDMQKAYQALFDRKWAHSIEVWDKDTLIGGLYGVWMGDVFCGESMFHTKSEASKIALLAVSVLSMATSIKLIDCQIPSGHLRRMGAKAISRKIFLSYLPSSQLDKKERCFLFQYDKMRLDRTTPADLLEEFVKEKK